MSRWRTFCCGRPRCLRNCPHRQTFSSTWPSSPKGTRRCTSKSPLRPRRCLGSLRAPSPTTLRFLRVWVGSMKRTQIGKSTRWQIWLPTSPLPYPTSKSLPPLPMQLSVRWVSPRPRLLPLQLSPLPHFPKPPLKRRLGKRSRVNNLPPNTLPCWPIWQGRVSLSRRISRREL